jgi:hypothetical protein
VAVPAAEDERGRSTIAFPYSPLKDAEQIARELHDKWGDSAQPEQLAQGMNQRPRSGAFRMKVSAARIFGLVDVSRGRISLTQEGRRIIDPETRSDARVKAFLHVPLFKAVFEEYKSGLLPPPSALERKMAELGVSSKQTDRARQTLQRSAELAGFFQHGSNRLVQPAAHAVDPRPGSDGTTPNSESRRHKTSEAGDVPDAVQELWLTLLDEGESWSAEKTHDFVATARRLRDLLSGDA